MANKAKLVALAEKYVKACEKHLTEFRNLDTLTEYAEAKYLLQDVKDGIFDHDQDELAYQCFLLADFE